MLTALFIHYLSYPVKQLVQKTWEWQSEQAPDASPAHFHFLSSCCLPVLMLPDFGSTSLSVDCHFVQTGNLEMERRPHTRIWCRGQEEQRAGVRLPGNCRSFTAISSLPPAWHLNWVSRLFPHCRHSRGRSQETAACLRPCSKLTMTDLIWQDLNWGLHFPIHNSSS